MRHNIEELFAVVKEYHAIEELSVKVNVQHDGLRPTLRPYQKRAVSWMLHQEGFGRKKDFEGNGSSQTFGKVESAHMYISCKIVRVARSAKAAKKRVDGKS